MSAIKSGVGYLVNRGKFVMKTVIELSQLPPRFSIGSFSNLGIRITNVYFFILWIFFSYFTPAFPKQVTSVGRDKA